MDNNKGEFKVIEEDQFKEQMKKENPQVFKVGEVLEIRGSRLRVQGLQKNKMILKLLPKKKDNGKKPTN